MHWLNSAGTGWNNISPPVSGVPPPELTVLPLKFVARPCGDAVSFDGPHYFWSVDFLLYFGWGSAPDPTGGAYSAPPYPIAGFKGTYF